MARLRKGLKETHKVIGVSRQPNGPGRPSGVGSFHLLGVGEGVILFGGLVLVVEVIDGVLHFFLVFWQIRIISTFVMKRITLLGIKLNKILQYMFGSYLPS